MSDIEKAIEILNIINHNAKVKHMTKDMSDGTTNAEKIEYIEDFRLIRFAISSLEKQIPKKPTSKPWNGINGVPYKNCPNCGGLLWGSRLDREDKFCKECGQAIDWKGEQPHE